jgi:hypothetical protein
MFVQTASRTIDQTAQSRHLVENEPKLSRIAAVFRQIHGHISKLPMLVSTYRRLRRYKYDPISQRATKTRRAFVNLDGNARRHKVNPCVTLSKTARPRAMAELSERIGFDGRIRHVRDEQYFSWRFQNPLSEYRFLFWEKGRRLDGFIALYMKVYPSNNDELAYIVDWDAINGHIWNDLLQAVIQWGNFNHISIWSEALSEEMKRFLQKVGFAFKDKTGSVTRDFRGKNILVKSLNQTNQPPDWILGGRDLLDPNSWDLRTIYSDDF